MTKKQSQIMQGIAILLMVYHHFFLNPEQLSSWVSYGNMEFVRHFAWFGKICVGLFCFVSGYGLFHTISRISHETVTSLLKSGYRDMLLRILRLYCKFWCVLIVFKGLDVLFLGAHLDFSEFLGNFTGICVTYNGTWWFLMQYVEMLLFLPLLDLLFTHFSLPSEQKKKHIIFAILSAVVMCIAVLLFLFSSQPLTVLGAVKAQLRPAFLAVFVAGYIIARFGIFSRLTSRLYSMGKGCLPAVSFLGLVCSIAIRVLLTEDASFAALDFLLVPLFCFGILQLLSCCSFLSGLLARFGQISVWLWLLHTCVYADTIGLFERLASIFPSGHLPSLLFYLAELAISSLCSLFFASIFRFLKKIT